MAVGIAAVHIIVVVFPVPGSRVIGRVDIDAVHLPRIQILQHLQGVVVVRFNQRVPQVAVRRVADRVDGLQVRINRLAEFRNGHKVIQGKLRLRMIRFVFAYCFVAVNGAHNVNVGHLPGFQRHFGLFPDFHIIKRRAFRQMLLKDQAELLLFGELGDLRHDPLPQRLVIYLPDQIL